MADRPTSAGMVQVDLDGFKDSVDKQFESVQRQFSLSNKMILGIYALLFGAAVGAIGGGVAIYREIGEVKSSLKTEIVSTKAAVTALQDRIKLAEDRLATKQEEVSTGLARINDTLIALRRDLTPATVLFLSPIEEDAIRSVFFLPKGPPKEAPKYKIGDLTTGAFAFPDDILAKAPRLKDFRYLKDPNGSVIIVSADNRVVAIVAPV